MGHEPDLGNNRPIITLAPPTGLFVGVGAILVGIVATFAFPFHTVFPLWGRPAFYLLLTFGSFLIVIELLNPVITCVDSNTQHVGTIACSAGG